MDQHLTAEQVQCIVDGELEMQDHVEHCGRCATAIAGAQQFKSDVRMAMRTEPAPAALRNRLMSKPSVAPWWIAAAAVVVAMVIGAAYVARDRSRTALSELADMHVTLLAGANPVDVISTDRHTVKPWFEGRLPFAVPVPDLATTPFRLLGGRVVYWRGNPAAYLLIGKGAHRISLFVFRDDQAPPIAGPSLPGISSIAWRDAGMTLVAVADVPTGDLQQLRAAFSRR